MRMYHRRRYYLSSMATTLHYYLFDGIIDIDIPSSSSSIINEDSVGVDIDDDDNDLETVLLFIRPSQHITHKTGNCWVHDTHIMEELVDDTGKLVAAVRGTETWKWCNDAADDVITNKFDLLVLWILDICTILVHRRFIY
jgi:hypothetical protein